MQRDYKIYLKDILDAIERIEEYTESMDFEDFINDNKTQDAVLRNLEIIGEAVKNIPEEIREMHKEINWKGFAGLRDIVIHQYFGVD